MIPLPVAWFVPYKWLAIGIALLAVAAWGGIGWYGKRVLVLKFARGWGVEWGSATRSEPRSTPDDPAARRAVLTLEEVQMNANEKIAEAECLEAKAEGLRREASGIRRQELLAKPLAERLVYAASARCPCGAGLAYDPAGEVGGEDGTPHYKPNAWDCSAILLGTAILKGQPGAVLHTGVLSFSFYEIKSESQPSAGGATTRTKATA